MGAMKTDQTILVTGTSSGFGLLIVRTLAQAGYTVVATMRGIEGKNAAAAKSLRDLAQDNGWRIHVVEMDVAADASVEAGIAEARRVAGPIDVVVNNAGVGCIGLAETFTAEQAQSLFNVNVFGIQRVNRAVLPEMRERGRGLLVHISSGLGRYVIPFMGIYVASKFAVEALAETYRYELGSLGIESVIVQPGAFGTDFSAHGLMGADGSRAAGYGPIAEIPMNMGKSLGAMLSAPDAPQPQEIADAVLKLVQTPAGQRPARTVVDRYGGHASTAVNQVCAQVTESIFAAFQMTPLLTVKTPS